jgi:hypothetical protein
MDDVAIANMTLQAIGTRSNIVSLDEASPEANNLNLVYAQTRDELLRKYQWNFARMQAPLSLVKAAQGTTANPTGTTLPIPMIPWLYSYAWPEDCIAIRMLLPIIAGLTDVPVPIFSSSGTSVAYTQTPNIKYVITSDLDAESNPIKVIMANVPQAQIIYTKRILDPNLFDSLFVTAFIGRLAGKVGFSLSGDKTLLKMAMDAGREAEAEAEAADGSEGIQVQDTNPDWLNARGYDDITRSFVFAGNGVTTDII